MQLFAVGILEVQHTNYVMTKRSGSHHVWLHWDFAYELDEIAPDNECDVSHNTNMDVTVDLENISGKGEMDDESNSNKDTATDKKKKEKDMIYVYKN